MEGDPSIAHIATPNVGGGGTYIIGVQRIIILSVGGLSFSVILALWPRSAAEAHGGPQPAPAMARRFSQGRPHTQYHERHAANRPSEGGNT